MPGCLNGVHQITGTLLIEGVGLNTCNLVSIPAVVESGFLDAEPQWFECGVQESIPISVQKPNLNLSGQIPMKVHLSPRASYSNKESWCPLMIKVTVADDRFRYKSYCFVVLQ